MIGLLLAIYPAAWRRRYGEEFQVVLESRPLGPFDVADVLLGALDARLALRFAEVKAANGGRFPMLRIGRFGAILGGVLWFVGLAVASAAEGDDDTLWMALILVGTIGLLLALAGLSAFQAHREPRLAWVAFGIPAIGSVLSIAGLAGMGLTGDAPFIASWSPWSIWVLGLLTTLLGSILFAIATIRAAVFSERAAIALAVSSVVLIGVAFGLTGRTDNFTDKLVLASSVGAFAASWVLLGVSALRRGPIRAVIAG